MTGSREPMTARRAGRSHKLAIKSDLGGRRTYCIPLEPRGNLSYVLFIRWLNTLSITWAGIVRAKRKRSALLVHHRLFVNQEVSTRTCRDGVMRRTRTGYCWPAQAGSETIIWRRSMQLSSKIHKHAGSRGGVSISSAMRFRLATDLKHNSNRRCSPHSDVGQGPRRRRGSPLGIWLGVRCSFLPGLLCTLLACHDARYCEVGAPMTREPALPLWYSARCLTVARPRSHHGPTLTMCIVFSPQRNRPARNSSAAPIRHSPPGTLTVRRAPCSRLVRRQGHQMASQPACPPFCSA